MPLLRVRDLVKTYQVGDVFAIVNTSPTDQVGDLLTISNLKHINPHNNTTTGPPVGRPRRLALGS